MPPQTMQDPDEDYHNFSAPSPHRLPTISGTQAIRNAVRNSRPISTGLASLDAILASANPRPNPRQGLLRGTVTELFGPPGVGKTTLALQAVVNTIRDDKARAVWIDTSSTLLPSRFLQLLKSTAPVINGPEVSSKDSAPQAETIDRFSHIGIRSLPMLLAMFLHPMADFPPSDASLIVLDDLSNFINASLPRTSQTKAQQASQTSSTQIRKDHAAKQALSKRAQIISSLATALQTFASTHNVAVLVTSKARISLETGRQAFLRSAMASQQWDICLGTRILLFRDFWPRDAKEAVGENRKHHDITDAKEQNLRYAQVIKLAGRDVSTGGVGFIIQQHGLYEVISPPTSNGSPNLQPATQNFPDSDEMQEEANQEIDGMLDGGHTDFPSSPVVRAVGAAQPQLAKRKAVEIADSDDDEVDAPRNAASASTDLLAAERRGNDDDQLPGNSIGLTEFQLTPTFQTAKKVRVEEHAVSGVAGADTTSADVEQHEEMLLDLMEVEPRIPPFSQAAAEMSDPLTPSDDGVGSP